MAFIYIPVVASWRLDAPLLARCAASALCGCAFYAVYDVAGAKVCTDLGWCHRSSDPSHAARVRTRAQFLWWTWHDTDAAVAERWCGVPIGSTMWTATHGFCFHLLVQASAPEGAPLGASRFARALVALCLGCTPFMMLAMAPFQLHQLRFALPAEQPLPRALIEFPRIAPLGFPGLALTQLPGRRAASVSTPRSPTPAVWA